MNNESGLHLFTDESTRPFEEGKCPYPRTARDDEFDKMIIKKYGLVTAEEEQKNKSNSQA